MTDRTLADLEAARDTTQAAVLDFVASHNEGVGAATLERLKAAHADAVRDLEAHPDFGKPPARPEAPKLRKAKA